MRRINIEVLRPSEWRLIRTVKWLWVLQRYNSIESVDLCRYSSKKYFKNLLTIHFLYGILIV
jgi:hypothetical protein